MRGSQMMCRCPLRVADNVFGLGEVADFGKIKLQLKIKYDAKRKRE